MKCFKHINSEKEVKNCKFCNYHLNDLKDFSLNKNNKSLILPRRKQLENKIETQNNFEKNQFQKPILENKTSILNLESKLIENKKANQNSITIYNDSKLENQTLESKKSLKYSKFFKITKNLPNNIANQIAISKIKNFSFFLIFFCFFIYALINFVYIFEVKNEYSNLKLVLFLFFLVSTIFLMIYFFIKNLNLNNFAKNYQKSSDQEHKNANFFLKTCYLNHIKYSYYWISFLAICITYSFFILPFLYLLNAHQNQTFSIGWIVIGKVPNLGWLILDWWICLLIVLTITFLNILFNLNHKKALNNALIENIISTQEIEKTKKSARKIALIVYFVFLTILIFFILFFIISKIKSKINKFKKPSA